jgi:Cobalamin-independent synthase, N-terminal domain.
MATASNLGYPRIGAHRELKRAVEGYWKGGLTKDELRDSAQALRESHWATQQELGLDVVPSNDFSYYDQVLDACAMVGAVPERFPWDGTEVDLDTTSPWRAACRRRTWRARSRACRRWR